MAPRVLYVVTEDWYFISHRLPMARAARAAGYEVHVATRLGDRGAAIEREGFIVHGISWSRGSLSPGDSLLAMKQLRRLVRRLRPEIVHNVSLKPVLLGTAATINLPPAVINSLTGLGSLFTVEGPARRLVRVIVRLMLHRLLRRNKCTTIVQNPDDQRFVQELGVALSNIAVIRGSGVDTTYFEPLPEPPLPVAAAYVGRMLVDKGVPELIQAYSQLRRKGVALRLVLAGDCDSENPGSLDPEQLREAAQLHEFQWLGHITDIRGVWREAHFAVLASHREGLPKSLLEAAACGRPMVATDAPGCREIAIQGVTALTVPIGDVDALAEAMERMAADRIMRQNFAIASRELVSAEFSAEVIGRATVALYDKVTARDAGSRS